MYISIAPVAVTAIGRRRGIHALYKPLHESRSKSSGPKSIACGATRCNFISGSPRTVAQDATRCAVASAHTHLAASSLGTASHAHCASYVHTGPVSRLLAACWSKVIGNVQYTSHAAEITAGPGTGTASTSGAGLTVPGRYLVGPIRVPLSLELARRRLPYLLHNVTVPAPVHDGTRWANPAVPP